MWRTPCPSITLWPWEQLITARGPTSSTWGRPTGESSCSRLRKICSPVCFLQSLGRNQIWGSFCLLFAAGMPNRCSRGLHVSTWSLPCFQLHRSRRRSDLWRDSADLCCRDPTPSCHRYGFFSGHKRGSDSDYCLIKALSCLIELLKYIKCHSLWSETLQGSFVSGAWSKKA